MGAASKRAPFSARFALVLLLAAVVPASIVIALRSSGPAAVVPPTQLGGQFDQQLFVALGTEVRAIEVRPLANDDARFLLRRSRDVSAALIAMLPENVSYTIINGGTLRQASNMFGIYHHEIAKLNPTLELDQPLAPGTKIVVHRRVPGLLSRSIGSASAGSLENAVPMLEGPGRILRTNRYKSWATDTTIAHLDWVFNEWARRFSEYPPLLVGNLSIRKGGRNPPHQSHQSGRDVDLCYVELNPPPGPPSWKVFDASNFDPKGNWAMLRLLEETKAVQVMLVDYELQKLLYDYALANQVMSNKELAHWLQYPDGPKVSDRLVRHGPGHADHIHVRFLCTAHDTACVH
ncbi:MAG: penicillin-insensitive murein endopeptidase [Myxococcota bacterium]|nr:penicillin-insensitive murein endopeptidase [Myxococcota bacterium]